MTLDPWQKDIKIEKIIVAEEILTKCLFIWENIVEMLTKCQFFEERKLSVNLTS